MVRRRRRRRRRKRRPGPVRPVERKALTDGCWGLVSWGLATGLSVLGHATASFLSFAPTRRLPAREEEKKQNSNGEKQKTKTKKNKIKKERERVWRGGRLAVAVVCLGQSARFLPSTSSSLSPSPSPSLLLSRPVSFSFSPSSFFFYLDFWARAHTPRCLREHVSTAFASSIVTATRTASPDVDVLDATLQPPSSLSLCCRRGKKKGGMQKK